MNLLREAVRITHELQEVVFVGALAIFAHISTHRRTRDVDIALASSITEEKLEKLGYHSWPESGKEVRRTPRGVKLDIYRNDVSGIPVVRIFETAVTSRVGRDHIKVMCLEALLVAKLRAGRPTDNEDVQELCLRKGRSIRWDILESMATPAEGSRLRAAVSAFAR